MSAFDRESPAPEELLTHATWIRRLARRLVGDDAGAEDLVQDTWVAAMTRPPREPRALPSWLSRVVRNLARERHRQDARRQRREEAVERELVAPSTDDLIEAVDAQRTVVEELLALDEPYRSVLLLRFFQDLTPSEIARARSQPAATVRSQLARGLALLRERMEVRDESGRLLRALAIGLPLPSALPPIGATESTAPTPDATSASPSSPIAQPPPAPAGGLTSVAASGSSGGALTTVLMMNQATKILAAAGVAGALYFGWQSLAVTPPEPLERTDLTPASTPLEPIAELDGETELQEPERERVEPVEAAATEPEPPAEATTPEPMAAAGFAQGRLRARFVDANGVPLPDVELRVKDAGFANRGRAHSDAGGEAFLAVDFTRDWKDELLVSWWLDGFASDETSVQLGPGDERHLGTIELPLGAAVEGRVLGPRGEACADAWVWCEPAELPVRDEVLLHRFGSERRQSRGPLNGAVPATAVRSDANGRYHLDGLPVERVRLWCGREGRRFQWSGELQLASGELRTGVDLLLPELEPEDHITGRVVDTNGQPRPDAQVSYQFTSDDLSMSSGVTLDSDGRFDLLVHRPVPFDFTARLKDGSLTPASLGGVLPGTLDVELVLGAAAVIELYVTDPDGAPIERYAIATLQHTDSGIFGTGDGPRDYPGGRAPLSAPPGRFSFSISADGYAQGSAGPFENGVVPGGRIDLVLDPLPVVRGVVLADGEPVEGATLRLAPKQTGDYWVRRDGYLSRVTNRGSTAKTDARGRFEISPDGGGVFFLRAIPPESDGEPRFAPVEVADIEVKVGHADSEQTIELQPAATLIVTVRREDGGDPAGTLVSLNRYDAWPVVVAADSEGRARIPGLMAGDWWIDVADEELGVGGTSSSSGMGAPTEWPSNCRLVAGRETPFELVVPIE